jgi:hypothetical protein
MLILSCQSTARPLLLGREHSPFQVGNEATAIPFPTPAMHVISIVRSVRGGVVRWLTDNTADDELSEGERGGLNYCADDDDALSQHDCDSSAEKITTYDDA